MIHFIVFILNLLTLTSVLKIGFLFLYCLVLKYLLDYIETLPLSQIS